jgi:hypothetical protein
VALSAMSRPFRPLARFVLAYAGMAWRCPSSTYS